MSMSSEPPANGGNNNGEAPRAITPEERAHREQRERFYELRRQRANEEFPEIATTFIEEAVKELQKMDSEGDPRKVDDMLQGIETALQTLAVDMDAQGQEFSTLPDQYTREETKEHIAIAPDDPGTMPDTLSAQVQGIFMQAAMRITDARDKFYKGFDCNDDLNAACRLAWRALYVLHKGLKSHPGKLRNTDEPES